MTRASFNRRVEALEAMPGYRFPENADDATDQQLVTLLVRQDTILFERACRLGRPLRPSDVTDDDLLRIIAEG